MRLLWALAFTAVTLAGCAFFGSVKTKDVNAVLTITPGSVGSEVTRDNAEEVLGKYSVDFTIPNPLFDTGSSRYRRFDPSHQHEIFCKAVLLDDVSTRADILARCVKDSLDECSCREFEKEYLGKNVEEGMFRIRISMESGFSKKSMEPGHWAFYIEDANGVMIEPVEIRASEVTVVEDSVYSAYHRAFFPRTVLSRDITCYFERVMFFGEDLFGGQNPFIIFVMSREKRELVRIAWARSEDVKQLRVPRRMELEEGAVPEDSTAVSPWERTRMPR